MTAVNLSAPLGQVTLEGNSADGRRCLLENDYEPIPICGKRPLWEGWCEGPITPERFSEVEAAYPDHLNTGLRTGRLAVADIDLWNGEHAADISEMVCDVLGETLLRRVGQKGVALLFHNPEPLGKITVSGKAPGESKASRLIEFLGTGQQLACFGIHPDTGRAYDWEAASLGETPLDIPLSELPKVTPAMLREAASAVSRRLAELGYQDLHISESGVSRDDESPKAGEPVTAAMLESMLRHVDPGCDRQAWISIGGAIKSARVIDSATGEDDELFDGLDLFTRWSAGDLSEDHEPGNFKGPADCEETWNSLSNTRRGGSSVGTLVFHARGGGYSGPVRVSAIERFYGGAVDRGQGVTGGEEPTSAHPSFIRNPSTGALSKTFPNALIAARHMEAVPELDAFNHRVVFRGPVPWTEQHGRVLDDDLLRAIRVHFLSEYGLDVAKEHVSEAVLTVAASNRFHPVREYLESLEWDGRARIDTWLCDYFGASDTPYVRAVGRKTLIGAVARAFKPGVKFDTMLVLQGRQGIGKSTGIRKLAGDAWFCDGLPGDLTKADAVQALQGAWIIEVSEFEGFSRSQVTTIKAFVSRQVDRARFAYDRHTKDYPRQCVFVASTNESAYLRDPTGGRRFWPVNVADVDMKGIESNRSQLWAEAVHAFREGESLILPRKLWADAAREQEERHNADPWEDVLREYLDGKGNPGPKEPVNRAHASYLLHSALGVSKGRQTANHSSRLRGIMENRLGWEYRRALKIGGSVSSGYVRPDTDDDE